jgi:cell division protein FtsI (penicillin-binding protein 3)
MMTERGKHSNPTRVAIVFGGIFLWSGLIVARLVQLQILHHDEYVQLALEGQQITRSIIPPRGVIYDSHMDELATNAGVKTVVAYPHRIKNVPAAAQALASILHMDFEELRARMSDPAHQTYMVVKRRIDPNDESRVEALHIDGVHLVQESMRVYPNRELACHILGFVNMNGDGGAGIEMQYDQELKGTQGLISSNVDAHQRSFRVDVEQPPSQGRSLILSLDRSIQYIAERELAAGVLDAGATDGTAIVMESDTGRILALAGYPSFNCNAYSDYSPDFWRNRAVSDLIEPGSTFKVVVATAALEEGLTRPDETVDCQMGSMTVANHVFHDHKPYGVLTFDEILEYSSNIGAAKLGFRLGERRLYKALRTFGFGSKTGIDLPGEIVGLVRDWRQWSGVTVAAISFGQGIGVTSMQILTAINAIANGGYHVRPSVVDRVIDENGDLVRYNAPERTRIMQPETAAAVTNAFEGVVLRGTGQQAALEGYRAAGKTGTAQEIVNGHYSETDYLASFIGFAPLPRPRITVLVQINRPKGSIYGGDVAAPIFKRITQEALLQLHVPPDPTVLPKVRKNQLALASDSQDFLPDATPAIPQAVPAEKSNGVNEDGTITVRVVAARVTVPDFTGMAKRSVVERCQELGITLQTSGAGDAVFQVPAAGTLIPVGDTCSVTFARTKPGRIPKPPAGPPHADAPAGLRTSVGDD